MPAHQNNLTRRGAIYHFRRRVPRDILPRVKKNEITKTLATADPVEARKRAKRAGVASDDAFDAVRADVRLTTEDIHRLIRKYFEDALEEDEERRAFGSPHHMVYASPDPDDLDTDPVDADLEALGAALGDVREALATNNLRPVRGVAGELAGHDNPNMSYGRYGKKYPPSVLIEQLRSVDFGVELSHLRTPVGTQ